VLPAERAKPPKTKKAPTIDEPLPPAGATPRKSSPPASKPSSTPRKTAFDLWPAPPADGGLPIADGRSPSAEGYRPAADDRGAPRRRPSEVETARRAYFTGEAEAAVPTAAESDPDPDVLGKPSGQSLLPLLFNTPPSPDDDPPASIVPIFGPPPPR
jgi:hypothetical protein